MHPTFGNMISCCFVTAQLLAVWPAVAAVPRYEEAPIKYSAGKPNDPITALQARIDRNAGALKFSRDRGYLESLLAALDVPASSQTLVFSKTSLQRERISPATPRALYFNDDVYIGFVPGGEVLEIAAADPVLGMNFYTLEQREGVKPRLVRQTDSCLQCHGGSMTRDTPGLLVRSVYPDRSGQPIFSAGTHLTTHESPFAERWGGWYVTGSHGKQRHMGNVVAADEDTVALDTEAGANLLDLGKRFDQKAYPGGGHSDLVALLVLEHQAEMHNLITRANFDVRTAMRDARVMNEALERPIDFMSDSTVSRIRSACEPLVKYMLFSGEVPLTEPVKGTSAFVKDYAASGPRDTKGRSLRDLDLTTRLLKHPCSPLIYTKAFDALPPEARQYIGRRLSAILGGEDQSEEFAHLSPADREAIREILQATKPGLLLK